MNCYCPTYLKLNSIVFYFSLFGLSYVPKDRVIEPLHTAGVVDEFE